MLQAGEGEVAMRNAITTSAEVLSHWIGILEELTEGQNFASADDREAFRMTFGIRSGKAKVVLLRDLYKTIYCKFTGFTPIRMHTSRAGITREIADYWMDHAQPGAYNPRCSRCHIPLSDEINGETIIDLATVDGAIPVRIHERCVGMVVHGTSDNNVSLNVHFRYRKPERNKFPRVRWAGREWAPLTGTAVIVNGVLTYMADYRDAMGVAIQTMGSL
jgi:hypothetical protein